MYMKPVLDQMKGFELYITLKITFKKPQGVDTFYKTAFTTANCI